MVSKIDELKKEDLGVAFQMIKSEKPYNNKNRKFGSPEGERLWGTVKLLVYFFLFQNTIPKIIFETISLFRKL